MNKIKILSDLGSGKEAVNKVFQMAKTLESVGYNVFDIRGFNQNRWLCEISMENDSEDIIRIITDIKGMYILTESCGEELIYVLTKIYESSNPKLSSYFGKDEAEELIRIGIAATDAFNYYSMGRPVDDDPKALFDIISVSGLIDWHRAYSKEERRK